VNRFDRALARPPAATFAAGLTEAGLGAPDLDLALAQHAAYCAALERAGLAVVELPADPDFPDSTFVEDTAIVTARGAVLTRPGAASRAGETAAIAAALAALGVDCVQIEPPGTVDGGDVCETDDGFLIGLSSRTNETGARQLIERLAAWGYRAATLDVRALGPALLHLKSGLSELGEGRLAVVAELAGHPALAGRELVVVAPAEAYAANCIRVNDRVLVADGFPRFAAELERLGYRVERLAMSEFRKMDGGLSCLSLRLPAGLAGDAASA
jgi:dimethylargininase